MKWIRQDAFGNETVWYSQDVIEKIKELAEKTGCKAFIDIINEVDNEST